MSVKKQTNVRTGKMVRELMLADKEVSASLIMVYSNDGVNEEIKIEGLHPKSNEELFLSGNVDWNKSVIYKIVDFTGKAEVGKALLTSMKKNNLSLEIERVMWSKDKQGEMEVAEESPAASKQAEPANIHTPVAAKEEAAVPKPAAKASEPVRKEAAASVPASTPKPEAIIPAAPKKEMIEPKEGNSPSPVAAAPTPATKPVVVEAPFAEETDSQLAANYQRLVLKAKEVCQDYDLGIDVDDSIEALKGELQGQGISLAFDQEIMDTVQRLRELKEKGIQIDKILNLL